jgi:hypothetical protein
MKRQSGCSASARLDSIGKARHLMVIKNSYCIKLFDDFLYGVIQVI